MSYSTTHFVATVNTTTYVVRSLYVHSYQEFVSVFVSTLVFFSSSCCSIFVCVHSYASVLCSVDSLQLATVLLCLTLASALACSQLYSCLALFLSSSLSSLLGCNHSLKYLNFSVLLIFPYSPPSLSDSIYSVFSQQILKPLFQRFRADAELVIVLVYKFFINSIKCI